MTAIGLRTHIWNNNLKSLALLAGFPVLLFLLVYAGALLLIGYGVIENPSCGGLAAQSAAAFQGAVSALPFVIAGALIWFLAAWMFHQSIIDASMNARPVTREEEPRLWNLLENLCISRGLAMPSLRIIETPAMNAYASGLSEKQAAVTVTRGLMNGLDDDELEAVLAHELTHIRNQDVRLLVIAVIFVANLPLLFASTALAPLSFMPTWMGWLAALNPLTFAIEPIRAAYAGPLDLSSVLLEAPYGPVSGTTCLLVLAGLTLGLFLLIRPLLNRKLA